MEDNPAMSRQHVYYGMRILRSTTNCGVYSQGWEKGLTGYYIRSVFQGSVWVLLILFFFFFNYLL